MDRLIREIIEAFEAARIEFSNRTPNADFLRYLAVQWFDLADSSQVILTKHLTPVLEKHIKPDRPEPTCPHPVLYEISIGGVVPVNLEQCTITANGERYAITLKKE